MGDYHLVVLAPSSVQEAADLVAEGFDIADQYRTPVMILGGRYDRPDDGTGGV